MAITFVGHGPIVVNDTTIQTVGITMTPNAGTLTGDIMIAAIARDDDGDAWDDPPSPGWTIFAQEAETVGRDYRMLLAYKIATSDSEGPATFTGTRVTTNIQNSGAILSFRGVDTTIPFDVAYVKASHYQAITGVTDPTTHTYRSITTVTNDAWVLVAEDLGGGQVVDDQQPAGFTTRLSEIQNFSGNMQVWSKELAIAGLESPGASGSDVTGTPEGGSITLALRPGGAPVGTPNPMLYHDHFGGGI